jgi:hypothetical protein
LTGRQLDDATYGFLGLLLLGAVMTFRFRRDRPLEIAPGVTCLAVVGTGRSS